MSSPVNPNSTKAPNPAVPAAAQLADARLRQWHQQGESLLTIENLRSWVNTAGLVLFAPRPQIVAPAPSLVEAVLGAPNPNPTIEQTAQARSLLARLVAEGHAVPLNLLGAGIGTVHAGAPGDTPDFVASAAVFSYIFTLRGDKVWKQPPAAAGAFKVSPLAIATSDALARRGPSSAYDLATEVGKEVTEAAVLRSLAELWTHLRVLPISQPDGAPTLWELAGARFTKQIKAGANAGQPSALSALISLYLGQAIVASEGEIESFLSPLAARSRIRDVIHPLLAACQIDTVAVQGRTLLYIAGELPAFLAPHPALAAFQPQAPADGEGSVPVGEAALSEALSAAAGSDAADGAWSSTATGANSTGEGAPRIAKFIPKPRKIGTGYLARAKPSKPGAKLFAEKQSPAAQPAASDFNPKPDFKPRSSDGKFKPRAGSAPAPNRERRPFSKPPSSRSGKTGGFDKPWNEEKTRRRAAAAKPAQVQDNIPLRSIDSPGDSAASPSAGEAARSRAPRGTGSRDTKSPGGGAASSARPPRKTFSKPGAFARKREGFTARPAFGGDVRPPRGDFAPRKAYGSHPAGAPGFGGKPRSSKSSGFSKYNSKDKSAGKSREAHDRSASSESGKRIYRKFDAPRNQPARPYSSVRPRRTEGPGGPTRDTAEGAAPRNFTHKPAGFAAKKPFDRSPGKPGSFAGKKIFAKSSGKPGGPAAKNPFAKSSGKPRASSTGRPVSTFAKFAGNRKPFGKRPPARKFKPGKDSSA